MPDSLLFSFLGFLVGLLMAAVVAVWRFSVFRKASQTRHDDLEKSALTQGNRVGELEGTLGAIRQERERLQKEIVELNAGVREHLTAATEAKTRCIALDEALNRRAAELAELQTLLQTQFEQSTQLLVSAATQRLTAHNREQMDTVLTPLRERLEHFQRGVELSRTEAAGARGELMNELRNLKTLNERLSTEANNLVTALKGETRTQGAWGELILETVLEKSGLTRGVEFETQESFTGEQGKRLRPDVVVYYPENKACLIIDAKVSLIAYERFCSASDELEKSHALREHAASVENHIRMLGEKSYQNLRGLGSPDFVLMFIPIEPAFTLAIQQEPGLYEQAFDQNVVIITPATLLATLRLVRNLWTQDRQNKNALEIARRGGLLLDKFADFYKSMEGIGRHIDEARHAYDESRNRLQDGRGSLVNQARQLADLGAKATKSLPQPALDQNEEPEPLA